MATKGLLIVISGPSGAGKGTVCRALTQGEKDLCISVSKTTRKPRDGEKDGINYFFVGKDDFFASVADNDFLEYACVYGQYYGTPRQSVEKTINAGCDVILEIDTQGALQVKATYPEGVFIFLLPPSVAELRSRINGRGTETPESAARRLSAVSRELAMASMYDYVVINDLVEEAGKKIKAIIRAEKLRVTRNSELIKGIIEEAKI